MIKKIVIFLIISFFVFSEEEGAKEYFLFEGIKEKTICESTEKFNSIDFGEISFEGIGSKTKSLIFKSGKVYFKVYNNEEKFEISKKAGEDIKKYKTELTEKEESTLIYPKIIEVK